MGQFTRGYVEFMILHSYTNMLCKWSDYNDPIDLSDLRCPWPRHQQLLEESYAFNAQLLQRKQQLRRRLSAMKMFNSELPRLRQNLAKALARRAEGSAGRKPWGKWWDGDGKWWIKPWRHDRKRMEKGDQIGIKAKKSKKTASINGCLL